MTFRFKLLGSIVFGAALAACGGRTFVIPPTGDVELEAFSHHRTFAFTGGAQTFEVPHVKWLLVDIRGAAGGSFRTEGGGGRGARIRALLPASLSKNLLIYVGGKGEGYEGSTYTGHGGGFNGGGAGGHSQSSSFGGPGTGGGGASDIRLNGGTIGERLIVAAGGGGAGGDVSGGDGGSGGGATGDAGKRGFIEKGYSVDCGGYGGTGGTQTIGGAGGKSGNCGPSKGAGADGSLGIGGSGMASSGYGGGGGGGGLYGGGGGGAGIVRDCTGENYCNVGGGGGGGGGSSFVDKRARNAHMWKGWKSDTGNGLVIISW